MRILRQFVEAPRACSYLADRSAQQEVHLLEDVSPTEYEALLVRGYRRFGPMYFRPSCPSCTECVSLRVPTESFAPTKSQRRAEKAASGLRVELGVPRIDDEHLDLFRRWHAARETSRGWAPQDTDEEQYYLSFAYPHPSVRELSFYDDAAGGKLVGVGICDETPSAWSAVYFYFDPAYARLSLGVVNVLTQLRLARKLGIPYVYLGYRVLGCASLRYKSNYGPHELLSSRPPLNGAPPWECGSVASADEGKKADDG